MVSIKKAFKAIGTAGKAIGTAGAAAALVASLAGCASIGDGSTGNVQQGTYEGARTGRCFARGEIRNVYYNVRGQLEGVDIVGYYDTVTQCGRRPNADNRCFIGIITDSLPTYRNGIYRGDSATREGYVPGPCGPEVPRPNYGY